MNDPVSNLHFELALRGEFTAPTSGDDVKHTLIGLARAVYRKGEAISRLEKVYNPSWAQDTKATVEVSSRLPEVTRLLLVRQVAPLVGETARELVAEYRLFPEKEELRIGSTLDPQRIYTYEEIASDHLAISIRLALGAQALFAYEA